MLDEFGYSVAVSGDTVVVGAYAEDSNAIGVNGNQSNNSATDSGAAYVFTGIGEATLAWPVDNHTVTRLYYAAHPTSGQLHTGLDIVSATGSTNVRAAAAGIVRVCPQTTYDPNSNRLGNAIIIDHFSGKGPFTLYGHLASFTVSNGQSVARGQQIGVMGDTGAADGVHLHFEVKFWGVLGNLHDDLGPEWGYTPGHPNLYGYINPQAYLDYNLNPSTRVAVRSSTNQIVRTGPDSSLFTTSVSTINADQLFVAFAEYAGWYQVYLPSLNGPATGWIQATKDVATGLLQVTDPARGTTGVSVRATATASASLLSYVWDKQWLVKLNQNSSGNGCSDDWYQLPIPPNGGTNAGTHTKRFYRLKP